MIQQIEITLPEYPRGFHLVTDEIINSLRELPKEGILHLFIKHTSAGLTINENADPTVREDFADSFDHIVKEREPFYRHTLEGDDDMPAHIKASLVGFCSVNSDYRLPTKFGCVARHLSLRIPQSRRETQLNCNHLFISEQL